MLKSNKRKSHQARLSTTIADGFTLIEVLVAIVVFASLSLAAYQVVNQVQRSNQVSIESTQRLQEIQRAIVIMDSDIRQMASRPFALAGSNGEQDDARQMLYEGQDLLGSDGNGLLFTRLGWLNPQQTFPRGEIVKVGYRLVAQKLERVWWRYPDTLAQEPPLERVLLSGVTSWQYRFFDGKQWHKHWQQAKFLPKGIEIKIELKDYGEIRRVYLVASSLTLDKSSNSDSGDLL